jgi:polyhydroxyalkanoate synthesis regulator phasin
MPDDDPVFDAFTAASGRGEMPTSLDTAGLRELSADFRRRMLFVARGTNAIFVSKVKEVIDLVAAGKMNDAGARAAIAEVLRALDYTPEGGFPDAAPGEVPPAVAGTLQDLSSFRRLRLIVRTQIELVQGAGLQMAGHEVDRLTAAPAWELIRGSDVKDTRDWPARWIIAGGKPIPDSYPKNAHQYVGKSTGMIALKGDPVWGELGSAGNFGDALDTDHPPFAFNSGMVWREIARHECNRLGITGPDGESIDEWLAGEHPTIAGKLPPPRMSMADVDPELVEDFTRETGAVPVPGRPNTVQLPPAPEPDDDEYDGMTDDEISAAELRKRIAAVERREAERRSR